jgi:hypothetical protein
MADLIQRVTAVAEQKARATVEALRPHQYPVATNHTSGAWEIVKAGHWMAGLFPGVMWQLHDLTGQGRRGKGYWADKARLWQAGLADRQREFGSQHDFGGWGGVNGGLCLGGPDGGECVLRMCCCVWR